MEARFGFVDSCCLRVFAACTTEQRTPDIELSDDYHSKTSDVPGYGYRHEDVAKVYVWKTMPAKAPLRRHLVKDASLFGTRTSVFTHPICRKGRWSFRAIALQGIEASAAIIQ